MKVKKKTVAGIRQWRWVHSKLLGISCWIEPYRYVISCSDVSSENDVILCE